MTISKSVCCGSISDHRSDISIPENCKYDLECSWCKTAYFDFRLKCDADAGLLRSNYRNRKLELRNVPGIGRFHDWLPVDELMTTDSGPVTYRSAGLAKYLGLSNLFIGFNGYWPERGAHIKTCSFKELEAFPTLTRFKNSGKSLVLASAGNTARAFAHVSAMTGVDVYIVVPGSGASRMWIPEEPTDSIHFIQMGSKCDYTDSIHLAERLSALPGMQAEGGARNVARRDGMGTVMLDASFFMKRLPDHYFQAIGSGTGGIAAWEASIRLLEDGRFGKSLPELHLSQNLPFVPMFNAWNAGRRDIIKDIDMHDPKKLIHGMYADILSNREPPYSIPGGVYDALCATNGSMYAINNAEAKNAVNLFEDLEGIDIFPPAGVAVASLIEAVAAGKVKKEDYIVLNITGGGVKRVEQDYHLHKIEPSAYAENSNIPLEDLI